MSNAAERKPSEWIRPIIITVIGAVTSASLGYYLATKRAPPAITITVLDSRGTKLDEVPVDGVKDKGNVTITLSKDVIKTIVNRETTSNMLTSSNIEKEEILHKNKNNQALVTSPHPDRPVEVKVTSKHPEQ